MRRAVLVVLLAACSPASTPAKSPDNDTEYPCVLHEPRSLTPDFAVDQHVVVKKGDRTGEFDGVLQKRGDELIVVGLGPMGVRAFVLRQEGATIEFEQSMGPPLPFPPRNVLVDVHRAFFKRLPSPPADGEHQGHLDDEEVTEIWKAGSIVERRYERPSFRPGAVRVHYGPGCTAEKCEPATVRIVNDWFTYELTITSGRFTPL